MGAGDWYRLPSGGPSLEGRSPLLSIQRPSCGVSNQVTRHRAISLGMRTSFTAACQRATCRSSRSVARHSHLLPDAFTPSLRKRQELQGWTGFSTWARMAQSESMCRGCARVLLSEMCGPSNVEPVSRMRSQGTWRNLFTRTEYANALENTDANKHPSQIRRTTLGKSTHTFTPQK